MMKQILSLLFLVLITISSSTFLYANEETSETMFENPPSNTFPDNNFAAPIETQDLSYDGSTPSPAPLGLIVDEHFSAISGASMMSSAMRGYQALDDALIPSSQGVTHLYMVAGRLGKFFLEDILFRTMMVTQHEIFGHGARAREFGFKVSKYEVGPWGGLTRLKMSVAQFNRQSPSKRIAFISGGVEGDWILASYLRNSWLETKCIDERVAHLYLLTAFDQTRYVLGTRDREHRLFVNNEGHDIFEYIKQINNFYGKTVLTTKKLRHKILFDFADPFFFYSLYGIGLYLLDGSQAFEYPMIPIGCYYYLPAFRIALAPYGPEYQFINYIKGLEHTTQFTLRYGNTDEKHSAALSLQMTRIWCADLLSIDGRVDIWHQPHLFRNTAALSKDQIGAAAFLTGRYAFSSCFEGLAQIGYKTSGYIPGEPLKRGGILRAGFRLKM